VTVAIHASVLEVSSLFLLIMYYACLCYLNRVSTRNLSLCSQDARKPIAVPVQ